MCPGVSLFAFLPEIPIKGPGAHLNPERSGPYSGRIRAAFADSRHFADLLAFLDRVCTMPILPNRPPLGLPSSGGGSLLTLTEH